MAETTRRGLRLRLTGGGTTRRRAWRRGRVRRVAAALVAAAAVWALVSALRPAAPDPGPSVVVAAADLAAGAVVTGADVRSAHVPQDVLPAGAATEPGTVVGSTLSRAVRSGEVLTDADTSVAALVRGLDPGTVVAHLPLTSPALIAAASPGTRVDVLAVLDGSVLAADVLVLAPAGAGEGLFVALARERSGEVARHTGADSIGGGVTVVLRAPAADLP